MKARANGSAVYVYAIGHQEQLRKLFAAGPIPAGVEKDTSVALVTEGDLAAVVTEVPLNEFGEGRFEEKLKDPAWAAEKVMRHERLTEFLATKIPVVPLRFGVMYSTPQRLREMLASRHARLLAILESLADREEWGLNIHVDRKKLYERMAELSPTLAEMQKRAGQSSPGQAYLLQKKLDSLRAVESKSQAKRVVHEIRGALEPEANSIKDLSIREIESRQEPAVVGKLSFLVDRGKLNDFRKTAEQTAAKYAPYGFSLELTGPWPPYNFSE